MYQITKFRVISYGKTLFRPLEREVFVLFSSYTRVLASYIPLSSFPRYLFEFVDFHNLKDRYNSDKYLTGKLYLLYYIF